MPSVFEAELPESRSWEASPGPEQLAALPATPAVYLLLTGEQQPVQLSTTQHLRRAVTARLAAAPDAPAGRRADLAEIVRAVRWRAVSAPFEARWWYYRLCRATSPHDYRRLVSFGPAWFLHLLSGPPEIRITDAVYRGPGPWIGPFSTRAEAQAALEGLWDMFELCRYPEQVRRAPHGQRCAYAEMGRCDAPCDGSVPLSTYAERVDAAWRFAEGGIEAWITQAAARMRAAAAAQRFERAALLRQQIDFARRWERHWSAVRSAAEWSLLLLLPITRRRAWRPFVFDRGILVEGPITPQRRLAAAVEAWLPGARASAAAAVDDAATGDLVRTEQAWLLAHFLHSAEASNAILLHLLALAEPGAAAHCITARLAELEEAAAPAAPEPPAQAGGD